MTQDIINASKEWLEHRLCFLACSLTLLRRRAKSGENLAAQNQVRLELSKVIGALAFHQKGDFSFPLYKEKPPVFPNDTEGDQGTCEPQYSQFCED